MDSAIQHSELEQIHLLETEVKHLMNDLQLTREEYETARRNYFEIYSKLAKINDQLNQEIVEKENVQDALAIRLKYEEGLANFSRALLVTCDDSIDSGIKFLHQAVKVSRIWVMENGPETSKGISARIIHEKNSRGFHSMKDHPLLTPFSFDNGLARWQQELRERNPIFGLAHEMTPSERKFLEDLSIESLLVLPIFVNEAWWGMMCFIDNNREKKWRSVDLRVLQTASEMLGVYIERYVAEERLKRAKKVAEEANRLKSQFVFNVSHEMRTPLNSIIGFTESIQQSNSVKTIHQHAQTVLQQSEMLLVLISDILDLAKIEAGKMLIENRSFSLRTVMEKLLKSVSILAKAKGLEIVIDINKDIPDQFIGDEMRILQVLMNLCSNAVKFTETGKIEIKIEYLNKDADTYNIEFHVIDTGIGIAKSRQKDIFKSFTQADGGITRKYGGTGLGTTIAHQLVELMGGKLKLQSKLGEGSHFWFSIPLLLGNEKNKVDEKLGKDVHSHYIKHTGKLLLVEDYWPNMQVALQHLSDCDCTVDTADNGFDAIKLCDQNAYDLILLDLQMPEISGYETAVKIRKSSVYCSKTPILAITAHADSSSREKCKEVGINDLITKPLRRVSFLNHIGKWLESNELYQEPVVNELVDEQELEELPQDLLPIDYERAIIEFGGNEKVLENVLEHFLIDIENQQVAFKNAMGKKDLKIISADAHRIRGGAANLTAVPLSLCAEKIEESAKAGETDNMESMMSDFSREAERLAIYINNRKK